MSENGPFYLALLHLGKHWTFNTKTGEWVEGTHAETKFETVVDAALAAASAPKLGGNQPYISDGSGDLIATVKPV
jgi:hypothetical protein